MAWPELTPGSGVTSHCGRGVHVVTHEHDRTADVANCGHVPNGTMRPIVLADLELFEVPRFAGETASAWMLTCQVRPNRLKSLT